MWSRLRQHRRTASAQQRVRGMGADVWKMAPAALALLEGGAADAGGEGFSVAPCEVADDEEFCAGGAIFQDGFSWAPGGDGDDGGGLQVATEELFFPGFVHFLLEGIPDGVELGYGQGGFIACEGGIRHGEVLCVDAVRVSGVFPCFICGEGEDGSEQPAEVVQHPVHGGLRAEPAGAAPVVAIHGVLGDVYVERAEVHRTELIQGHENLAEIIGRVGVEAVAGDGMQPLEDPAVQQCQGTVFHSVCLRGESIEIS